MSAFGGFGGGMASEPAAGSCPGGPDARISRSSRRKAPKNGTTGHSAMAKALLKARSYSAERSAADRKSSTGNVSFSVMDSQNGLSLLDLQETKFSVKKQDRNYLFDYPPHQFNNDTSKFYVVNAI